MQLRRRTGRTNWSTPSVSGAARNLAWSGSAFCGELLDVDELQQLGASAPWPTASVTGGLLASGPTAFTHESVLSSVRWAQTPTELARIETQREHGQHDDQHAAPARASDHA